MSFDSDLEVALVDGEAPDLGSKKAQILAQLDRDGIHHDVYGDVSDAFLTGRGHFRVHAAYLLQLLDALAEMFPDVPFDARGLGEDFRSTWIAEFREGKRIYTQGPWAYE
jgi:hypothetical protein